MSLFLSTLFRAEFEILCLVLVTIVQKQQWQTGTSSEEGYQEGEVSRLEAMSYKKQWVCFQKTERKYDSSLRVSEQLSNTKGTGLILHCSRTQNMNQWLKLQSMVRIDIRNNFWLYKRPLCEVYQYVDFPWLKVFNQRLDVHLLKMIYWILHWQKIGLSDLSR